MANSNKQYQWFQNPGGNNNKNNSGTPIFKRIWKWVRLIIYVLLIGIALTGCAQSFVLKTNKSTGSGYEFYNSVNQVSPRVISAKFDSKKGFTYDANENYYLSSGDVKGGDHAKDKDQLSAFHTQVVKNGGTFGGYYTSKNSRGWISSSTVLRVEGTNSPIASVNGEFLGITNSMTSAPDWGYTGDIKIDITYYPPKNAASEVLSGSLAAVAKPTSISENASAKEKSDFLANLDKYYRYSVFNYLLNDLNNKFTDKTSKEYASSIASLASFAGFNLGINTDKDGKVSTTLSPKWLDKAGQASIYSTVSHRPVISWKDAWRTGPFYALFVFPLAKLALALTNGMGGTLGGWETVLTILIIVILVRLLAYAISFFFFLNQFKQQEIQAKVAQINAKYEPYKDNKQMQQRKRMETMELYKKEGISMMGSVGAMFVTLPVLLSMWRVIGAVPHIKSTTIGQIQFGATSYKELFAGKVEYLPLMILSLIFQVLAALTPRLFSRKRTKRINVLQQQALKKQNKSQNIMLAVIAIFALAVNAGLQVYLTFSALFSIGQNTANHYIIKHQSKKRKKKVTAFDI